MPRHPDVHVPLVGEDGNAFAILGRARRACRKANVGPDVYAEYQAAATAGDYDHLLATTVEWFNTDPAQ